MYISAFKLIDTLNEQAETPEATSKSYIREQASQHQITTTANTAVDKKTNQPTNTPSG